MTTIYLTGSLRNEQVPIIAEELRRNLDCDVFDDWYAAGPRADDHWKEYEEGRGHTYQEALEGYAANHVFEYDRFHLNRCDIGVLVMPAGKSSHLELGYLAGQRKPVFILMDTPDRWDVMARYASVHFQLTPLINEIKYLQIMVTGE